MSSSPVPFRIPLAGSLLVHALLLAGALLLVPARPAAKDGRTRVWLDLPASRGESLSTSVAAASIPEIDLPEVREPEISEEVPPPEELEPLPQEEAAPPEERPFELSLSILGRRTKAPLPEPTVLPPPTARPPARVTEPLAHAPASAPAPSSAPARSGTAPAPAAPPLRILHAPAFTRADYPPEARRRGLEGTALVRITIGRSGDVVDAVLLRSSGSPLLDEDALRKSRLYRFAPIPSPRAENLPVRYRLE